MYIYFNFSPSDPMTRIPASSPQYFTPWVEVYVLPKSRASVFCFVFCRDKNLFFNALFSKYVKGIRKKDKG